MFNHGVVTFSRLPAALSLQFVFYVRTIPGTCLEGFNKILKNRAPQRDLNQEPHQFEEKRLPYCAYWHTVRTESNNVQLRSHISLACNPL